MSDIAQSRRLLAERVGRLGGEGVFTSAAEARLPRGVTCRSEETTFYFYPNITGAMKKGGYAGYETFRRTMLRKT
jgi:hypothetical protein